MQNSSSYDCREPERLCKVTPVILHGVVTPDTAMCRMTGVTLHEAVSPEKAQRERGTSRTKRTGPFIIVVLIENSSAQRYVIDSHFGGTLAPLTRYSTTGRLPSPHA